MKKMIVLLSLMSATTFAETINQRIESIENTGVKCTELNVIETSGCNKSKFSFGSMFSKLLGDDYGPAVGSCTKTYYFDCSNGLTSKKYTFRTHVDLSTGAEYITEPNN